MVQSCEQSIENEELLLVNILMNVLASNILRCNKNDKKIVTLFNVKRDFKIPLTMSQ